MSWLRVVRGEMMCLGGSGSAWNSWDAKRHALLAGFIPWQPGSRKQWDSAILPLCMGILGIAAPPVKTKLLSVKFELGPVQMCWKFSDL
jgi:hypothetical protein